MKGFKGERKMSTVINTLEKRTMTSNTNIKKVSEKKFQFVSSLKKYFLFPIESGLYGFYMVFTVVLLLKLVNYLLGINESFQVDHIDFLLSLVGFFLLFLDDLLRSLHRRG
jgi:hypothetical protein